MKERFRFSNKQSALGNQPIGEAWACRSQTTTDAKGGKHPDPFTAPVGMTGSGWQPGRIAHQLLQPYSAIGDQPGTNHDPLKAEY